jgi:hypothetical protein
MNAMGTEKRKQLIAALVEGTSINASSVVRSRGKSKPGYNSVLAVCPARYISQRSAPVTVRRPRCV